MRAAIYARESSKDAKSAPPIANQLEAGRAWAEREGHGITKEYVDEGYSGGDWDRPAWAECARQAKGHYYDLLWVWNQDRLARDTEQFLWFYRNTSKVGVRIFSETEGWIDMTSLGDRVKHTTLAQAAEIMRLVTSDKVKAAYQQAKRQGRPWGRKRAEVDLEVIQKLRSYGLGYRSIAREIGGKVSFITIRQLLLNPPCKE